MESFIFHDQNPRTSYFFLSTSQLSHTRSDLKPIAQCARCIFTCYYFQPLLRLTFWVFIYALCSHALHHYLLNHLISPSSDILPLLSSSCPFPSLVFGPLTLLFGDCGRPVQIKDDMNSRSQKPYLCSKECFTWYQGSSLILEHWLGCVWNIVCRELTAQLWEGCRGFGACAEVVDWRV